MWARGLARSTAAVSRSSSRLTVRGYQSRLEPSFYSAQKNLAKTEAYTEDTSPYVVEDSTPPPFTPAPGVKLLGFRYPKAAAPDNKTFYAITPRKPPMVVSGVAGEYVEKLYQASLALDCLMQTERELVEQVKPLTTDEEIEKKFFSNATIDTAEKVAAMEKYSADSKLSRVITGLLYEVVENDHTEHLSEIVKGYAELMQRVRCEANAEVTFGVPPTKAQVARVKQLLTDLRSPTQYYINVSATVQPSIGGGLILNVGDFELDGSLSTRCAEVQKHLSRSLQQQ